MMFDMIAIAFLLFAAIGGALLLALIWSAAKDIFRR